MQGEQGRGGSEVVTRFGRRLTDLKRSGCNVLVVGTDAVDVACERLLGESNAGPRYRLFVTTDARLPTARARLASVESGRFRDAAAVVNWQDESHWQGESRETTDGGAEVRTGFGDSGGGPGGGSGSRCGGGSGGRCGGGSGGRCGGDSDDVRGDDFTFRVESVESDDLDQLESAITETVEWFESTAGALSPAELRLCFDSVTPLVAADRDVTAFLADVTETVERVGGMGHYHLPVEYDAEAVAEIESLFDAVIEVRHDDRAEQRWHLTDPDVTTTWLEL